MNKKIYLYIFIVAVLVILAGIYVDKNVNITTSAPNSVTGNIPVSSSSSNVPSPQATGNNSVTLGNYGSAPDFKTGDTWLNSQPLTINDLKGKVVLVDFWTYSCINCIRTLPYVTKWYDTYQKDGLVVIGVHTPEFTFEHDTNNVKNAIAQFGIHYPVVQDNDYAIWNSYSNEYWPAEYLINQKGQIVEEHFGEGNYDTTEKDIRYLLNLGATTSAGNTYNLNGIGSPEMYFGTERLANLSQDQSSSQTPKNYTIDQTVPLNTFSIGGQWQFSGSNMQLTGTSGQITLKFHSAKLFIVAASQYPATLSVTVDGKKQPDVNVQASKLYTLFDSQDYSDHTAQITITQPGFEAFTFTFG